MGDIFISYAREDQPTAKRLAKALEKRHWTVWWDRRIPPGSSYARVIEAAIDAASCVIVLWSSHAVASHWVNTEAAEGLRRGILVPVTLEPGLTIPLQFRQIQAAELHSWKGDEDDEGFTGLVAAVSARLRPASVRRTRPARRGWRVIRLSSGTSWRTLRVSNSGDARVVYFHNKWFSHELTVDGRNVQSTTEVLDNGLRIHFQLAFGQRVRDATLQVETTTAGRILSTRLIIGTETVYVDKGST